MTNEASAAQRNRIGLETVSEWVQITQEMINQFADATGDHQFIHVDVEAARHSPFGGTIAHGFLTLSLFPLLASKAPGTLPEREMRMGVNYGGNKVRFVTPVRAGSRVRGRFKVLDYVQKHPGVFLQATEFIVEIEGADKPALVGEWLIQITY
jgi:acyl dehydratase